MSQSPDDHDTHQSINLADLITYPPSALACRLQALTAAQRTSVIGALSEQVVPRPTRLTLAVREILPNASPDEVGRDVAFLLRTVPNGDSQGEDLLLHYLAYPQSLNHKRICADWFEEQGDPRVPALRAEIVAEEAGMASWDVHGVLEAERHFGVRYTPGQLESLASMPFSPETLLKCKNTHLLIAGASLSLRDLHPLIYTTRDYSKDPFVSEQRVDPRWYLLRKKPDPESFDKTHDEQHALRGLKNEEVPRTCEVVYSVILHWLTRGERLLPGSFVRCREIDSENGNPILVGFFGQGGLFVTSDYNHIGHHLVGFASVQQS